VANDLFGTFEIARYTAANVPGARFVGYETGGHISVGHSEEITREIADFLK
jgi:2-hydroxy-6-oxonona-2,4-dienedioate hydrolase